MMTMKTQAAFQFMDFGLTAGREEKRRGAANQQEGSLCYCHNCNSLPATLMRANASKLYKQIIGLHSA